MPETTDKINLMVANYRKGILGTPDAPHRGSSLHHRFWQGYFGEVKPGQFRNTLIYPCVKAGAICAAQDKKP